MRPLYSETLANSVSQTNQHLKSAGVQLAQPGAVIPHFLPSPWPTIPALWLTSPSGPSVHAGVLPDDVQLAVKNLSAADLQAFSARSKTKLP